MAVEATRSKTETPASAAVAKAPVVIEARGVEKSFRLPGLKVDSLKERVLHPTVDRRYTTLRAIDGVSFDIHKGEFFGIVGRNGSGKSTLLKVMASIYRADAGTIRMAGRLAPFIELGVGFNMELTARENVKLNGVMMGLSRREAAGRLDAVLDFAELDEFTDLKLKNYSSGMLVRLAFSAMIQSDADVLLIDEVLAVGDAAFQKKCADVFAEMRRVGKTVVLVTHDMAAVQAYCHRAMLLDHGRVVREGEPSGVGTQYLRLNFEERASQGVAEGAMPPEGVRLRDLWLEGEDGERVTAVPAGAKLRLRAEVEAGRELVNPYIGFVVSSSGGVDVFSCGSGLAAGASSLTAGAGARIGAEVRNPLAPGAYTIHFSVTEDSGKIALWVPYAVDFAVDGEGSPGGIVSVDYEAEVEVEPGAGS